MVEPEKITKAKRQLLIVGVVCVSAVVFVLWLLNLREMFAMNRNKYASSVRAFKEASGNLGATWEDFRRQIDNIKK